MVSAKNKVISHSVVPFKFLLKYVKKINKKNLGEF